MVDLSVYTNHRMGDMYYNSLIVSRVRAYLTTDQQHGIPCFLKRGPLPDWPVWTREQMISGGAAGREDRVNEAERDKPNGTQARPR